MVLLQNVVITPHQTEFNDTVTEVTSLSRACYTTSLPQNPWSNQHNYLVHVNTVKITVMYFSGLMLKIQETDNKVTVFHDTPVRQPACMFFSTIATWREQPFTVGDLDHPSHTVCRLWCHSLLELHYCSQRLSAVTTHVKSVALFPNRVASRGEFDDELLVSTVWNSSLIHCRVSVHVQFHDPQSLISKFSVELTYAQMP